VTRLLNLLTDIKKADPDAVLVWGRPSDAMDSAVVTALASRRPTSNFAKIDDPVLGEMETVLPKPR